MLTLPLDRILSDFIVKLTVQNDEALTYFYVNTAWSWLQPFCHNTLASRTTDRRRMMTITELHCNSQLNTKSVAFGYICAEKCHYLQFLFDSVESCFQSSVCVLFSVVTQLCVYFCCITLDALNVVLFAGPPEYTINIWHRSKERLIKCSIFLLDNINQIMYLLCQWALICNLLNKCAK